MVNNWGDDMNNCVKNVEKGGKMKSMSKSNPMLVRSISSSTDNSDSSRSTNNNIFCINSNNSSEISKKNIVEAYPRKINNVNNLPTPKLLPLKNVSAKVVSTGTVNPDQHKQQEKQDKYKQQDQQQVEYNGIVRNFFDGHIPETFQSDSGNETKAVFYPQHLSENVNSSLYVYDNVLPGKISQDIYDLTAGMSTAGTYVEIEEAKNYICSIENDTGSFVEEKPNHNTRDNFHELAVKCVAHFLIKRVCEEVPESQFIVSSNPIKSSRCQLFEYDDLLQFHGVAVWCLASTNGSEVRYHMDYGELMRYEQNIIVPPLWAGTIHCTDFESSNEDIKGGSFAVNLDGWDHYRLNGYKGKLSGDDKGGWTNPKYVSQDKSVHYNNDSKWATVPYAYNRGIIHNGHLPHLSSPISNMSDGKKRVIIGLNIFGNDVGAIIKKAPEHSETFNNKVRMHRMLQSKDKMSILDLRKNKVLTKLLVLAKREKIKQDLKKSQRQLTQQIIECVRRTEGTTVLTLMNSLSCDKPNMWPSPDDVHVHVNCMLYQNNSDNNYMIKSKHNEFQLDMMCTKSQGNFLDQNGLVHPEVILCHKKELATEKYSSVVCNELKRGSLRPSNNLIGYD